MSEPDEYLYEREEWQRSYGPPSGYLDELIEEKLEKLGVLPFSDADSAPDPQNLVTSPSEFDDVPVPTAMSGDGNPFEIWPEPHFGPKRTVLISCGQCRSANGKRSRQTVGRLSYHDGRGWLLEDPEGRHVDGIMCPTCYRRASFFADDEGVNDRLTKRFLEGAGKDSRRTDLNYLERAGFLDVLAAPL